MKSACDLIRAMNTITLVNGSTNVCFGIQCNIWYRAELNTKFASLNRCSLDISCMALNNNHSIFYH